MKRVVLNTTLSRLEELSVPHNIEFIRFNITINNVDFIDGVNLTSDRLSHIMLNSPAAPSSSSPSTVEQILETFKDLENRHFTDVFVVAISSELSKSVENLKSAKALYTGKLNIFIYDTKAATIMEAALAFEADKLIQQGKSFEEIAWRLDKIREGSTTLITVSRLDYLIANKKISSPAGFFANLLDIKPVIELTQQGELIPIKKIRKIEKSLEYIAEEYQKIKQAGDYVYILGCGDDNLNTYFANLLAQKYGMPNLPMVHTSSITTANHGPNMVGMGSFSNERPLICKYL